MPVADLPAVERLPGKHIDRGDVLDTLAQPRQHPRLTNTLPDPDPALNTQSTWCAPPQSSAVSSEHAPTTTDPSQRFRATPHLPNPTTPGFGAVLVGVGGASPAEPQTCADLTPEGDALAMTSSARESCAGQVPRQQPPVTCSPALTPAVALSWPP